MRPVHTTFGYSTFSADSAFRHNMGSIQIWVVAMETMHAQPPVGRPTKMESVKWRAFLVLRYLLKLQSMLIEQMSTRRRRLAYHWADIAWHFQPIIPQPPRNLLIHCLVPIGRIQHCLDVFISPGLYQTQSLNMCPDCYLGYIISSGPADLCHLLSDFPGILLRMRAEQDVGVI